MPDLGELTRDRLPHTLPVTAPLYPAPPWPLPGARILKLAFETDAQTTLKWLPPSLGRTSPAYAIITVAHYPQSPLGPFSLATQFLGCRARMFIRAFALHAVTDKVEALAALREVWGFPARLGRVKLSVGKRSVSARVGVEGQTVAHLRLNRAESCHADLIRFDPTLNVRLVPAIQQGKRHSLLEVVQIDPEYAIKEALRGRPQVSYPEANEGSPWHLVRPLSMIAATYCVADTELPLARFVMPY